MSKSVRIGIAVLLALVVTVIGCALVSSAMKSDHFTHDKTYYEVGWDLEGNEVYREVIATYDNPYVIATIYAGIGLLGIMAGLTFNIIAKGGRNDA